MKMNGNRLFVNIGSVLLWVNFVIVLFCIMGSVTRMLIVSR